MDTSAAVGYLRVSTPEQAANGHSLAGQEAAIRKECERRSWVLAGVYRDEADSGKTLDRPGLTAALERISRREASGLVVSNFDRLTRSAGDCRDLLDWFARAEAIFVAVDFSIDTSTRFGRSLAGLAAQFAEWECETVAARTRDGLAALRAKGYPTGRPAVADNPELAAEIRRMRESGMTLQAIADHLNEQSVPTVRGGKTWRPSSVQAAAGYRRPAPQRPRGTDLPPLD